MRVASALRMEVQRKKFREVKMFTYDYGGKIISIAGQNTQKLKVNNLKYSLFY